MGFLFSKSMSESMKEQREFMSMNSRLQLERQLQMQNQMRERQMAMQVAWSRELFKYYGTFVGIATLGLTTGAIKRKRPAMFIPIIPLSFILAYQYDMGYGTLLHRIKGEAENILEKESTLIELPGGVPTFDTIEKARRAQRSLQATSNKDLDSLKMQSFLSSEVEQQVPRASMAFGRQPTKDIFNMYDDYNEYVPVSDDFNEYIRQVGESGQKTRSATAAIPPAGAERFPWIKSPRRKRDYSMGVAGMCCKWGCTKAEISALC